MPVETDPIEQKLAALRQRYFNELPEKLEHCLSLWNKIRSSKQYEKELERLFHKIAGSAGMYGAEELTRISRELEYQLVELEQEFTPALVESIDNNIENFRALVEQLSKQQ